MLLDTVSRPFVPHADFGATDCGGCLDGIIRGDQASIECNECGAVVRTVAAADLQRTLDVMELSLGMCTEMCPHCGKVNVFPGFTKMTAYTCWECGRDVEIGDS
jgi:uncharacterized protein (DUF983 family)